MAINSYAELGPYIDSILDANGESPVAKGHLNFWDTLTYQQFTTGNVPNVVDPTTLQPVKILVVGNSGASAIIQALRGTVGSLFDPTTGAIGRFSQLRKSRPSRRGSMRGAQNRATAARAERRVTLALDVLRALPQIRRPAPSQKGSRSLRLKILPESSRGSSAWKSTRLGTL